MSFAWSASTVSSADPSPPWISKLCCRGDEALADTTIVVQETRPAPRSRRVSIPGSLALDKLLPKELIALPTARQAEVAAPPAPPPKLRSVFEAPIFGSRGGSPLLQDTDRPVMALHEYLKIQLTATAPPSSDLPRLANWAKRAAAASSIDKVSLLQLKLLRDTPTAPNSVTDDNSNKSQASLSRSNFTDEDSLTSSAKPPSQSTRTGGNGYASAAPIEIASAAASSAGNAKMFMLKAARPITSARRVGPLRVTLLPADAIMTPYRAQKRLTSSSPLPSIDDDSSKCPLSSREAPLALRPGLVESDFLDVPCRAVSAATSLQPGEAATVMSAPAKPIMMPLSALSSTPNSETSVLNLSISSSQSSLPSAHYTPKPSIAAPAQPLNEQFTLMDKFGEDLSARLPSEPGGGGAEAKSDEAHPPMPAPHALETPSPWPPSPSTHRATHRLTERGAQRQGAPSYRRNSVEEFANTFVSSMSSLSMSSRSVRSQKLQAADFLEYDTSTDNDAVCAKRRSPDSESARRFGHSRSQSSAPRQHADGLRSDSSLADTSSYSSSDTSLTTSSKCVSTDTCPSTARASVPKEAPQLRVQRIPPPPMRGVTRIHSIKPVPDTSSSDSWGSTSTETSRNSYGSSTVSSVSSKRSFARGGQGGQITSHDLPHPSNRNTHSSKSKAARSKTARSKTAGSKALDSKALESKAFDSKAFDSRALGSRTSHGSASPWKQPSSTQISRNLSSNRRLVHRSSSEQVTCDRAHKGSPRAGGNETHRSKTIGMRVVHSSRSVRRSARSTPGSDKRTSEIALSRRTLVTQLRFDRRVPVEAIVLRPGGRMALLEGFYLTLSSDAFLLSISKGTQRKAYAIEDLQKVDAAPGCVNRARTSCSHVDWSQVEESLDTTFAGRLASLRYVGLKVPVLILFESNEDQTDFLELVALGHQNRLS